MTSRELDHPGAPHQGRPEVVEHPEPRRAYRDRDAGMIAGVCAGLATHLGWQVGTIRLLFVLLSPFNFLGPTLYATLWVVLPVGGGDDLAPGLRAAQRLGLRPSRQPIRPPRDRSLFVILAVIAVGLIWLVQTVGAGLNAALFWPLLFGAVGVALVWRQFDEPVTDDAREVRPAWLRPLLQRGGWPAVVRTGVGMMLVGVAVSLVTVSQIGWSQLPAVLLMTVIAVAGILIVAAPWLYRMRRDMLRAEHDKAMADARADMAAHLHDSVLQTLALIQRSASDPKTVATLARRQERELRTWLYGDVTPDETFKSALIRAAAEIEAERGIAVDIVTVGDSDLTPDLEAMVRAAREAMMNAAKHSGAPSVDVFAQVTDAVAEVFVRDRGVGFLMTEIDDDRMGVRRSIVERMERHGGRAVIKSAPGEGTEVRLEMNR